MERTSTRTYEQTDKPDSPSDLTKPSWTYVVRKTVREFSDDQCTDLAAALTYYAILALFPAALAMLSVVGLVSDGRDTVDALLQVLRDVGAGSAADTLEPTLVHADTLGEATRVQFPGLAGMVPGFGKMDPCDWGLGFELRDGKAPHWTGTTNSAATFGHFGGAGTFLWVDPELRAACVALTDRDFDEWAKLAWPTFGDAVLAEAAAPR